MNDNSGSEILEEYKKDFDAAERKIAGKIHLTTNWLGVVAGMWMWIVSLILPYAGKTLGWQVVVYTQAAEDEVITMPVRVYVWLAIVFGVVISVIALMTRRWPIAWVAAAGTTISMVFGVFSIWTRQTTLVATSAPGFGLVIAVLGSALLTFSWLRLLWARSAFQMELEQERRAFNSQKDDRAPWQHNSEL